MGLLRGRFSAGLFNINYDATSGSRFFAVPDEILYIFPQFGAECLAQKRGGPLSSGMEKYWFSYEDIHRTIRELADRVIASGYDPTPSWP
jgi:hypothetical protein